MNFFQSETNCNYLLLETLVSVIAIIVTAFIANRSMKDNKILQENIIVMKEERSFFKNVAHILFIIEEEAKEAKKTLIKKEIKDFETLESRIAIQTRKIKILNLVNTIYIDECIIKKIDHLIQKLEDFLKNSFDNLKLVEIQNKLIEDLNQIVEIKENIEKDIAVYIKKKNKSTSKTN